jgi:glycolate oxidase FAD binding subunit
VVEHAVGDFTLTAQSGSRLGDLQAMLAVHNQRLAIDPLCPEQATLGGIVATADTGSWRQRYGGIRDQLIGVQFVRYDGNLAKAGGRVVKNVAGYDLMKLMTGSYGTLAVLTQLTFRLYPLAECSRTLVLRGSAEAIGQLATQVRTSGLTPIAFDMLREIRAQGERQDSAMGAFPYALAAQFQGLQAGVDEQVNRLQTMGQALGLSLENLVGDAEALFWQTLRQTLEAREPHHILCKVGLLPTEMMAFLQLSDQTLSGQSQASFCGRLHNGSGLGLLKIMPETDSEAAMVASLSRLRHFCQEKKGFVSILQAPPVIKQKIDVWGYSGNASALMGRIKGQFDPNQMMNPARFIGGV